MADAAAESLAQIAEGLYAGPVEDFTEARNAAAKAAGDKELAAAVKRLRKPSVAAWAVNLLVRRESEQIDTVLGLGESLRAAAESLDGDELRALTRQRRQLTAALATSARGHARDAGVRLTDAVITQVEGVLTAALLDPVAAQVVRTGRVVTAFTSTGVSEIDLDAVVAVPEALEVTATPAEDADDAEPPAPELRVVPDNGAKLAAAKEALEEAQRHVEEAQLELDELDTFVERLNARRLQLQGEADELRRRIAAIEDDVDEVDEKLESAEDERGDAADVLREATRERDEAQRAVEKLEG